MSEAKEGRSLKIPIAKIQPDPEQPRRDFDEESLQLLADSLETIGQSVPIIVTEEGEKYLIVDGERRWRASRMKAIQTMDAIVVEDSENRFANQIVANFCREGHTAREIMHAVRRLREQKKTYAQIGAMFGKTDPWVNQYIRLAELDPACLDMVSGGHRKGGVSVQVAARVAQMPKRDHMKWMKKLEGVTISKGMQMLTRSGHTRTRAQRPGESKKQIDGRIRTLADTADSLASMNEKYLKQGLSGLRIPQLRVLIGKLESAAGDIEAISGCIEDEIKRRRHA